MDGDGRDGLKFPQLTRRVRSAGGPYTSVTTKGANDAHGADM
jgi:hypothetical protein